MLRTARHEHPGVVAEVLEWGSDVLGRDLAAQYCPENPDPFPDNASVQVGVFLADCIHLRILERHGLSARWSLGLSLGEYAHLLHIGALGFSDLLRLVDARGAAYDAGPDGMMAAVFPISDQELEAVVDRAGVTGIVEIGSYNSPTQHVISGERGAVEAALALLSEEFFLDGRILQAPLPVHSSCFAPVAEAFRSHLGAAPWRAPALPYIPNVLGSVLPEAAPGEVTELLRRHVCSPVRWWQSLMAVLQAVPDAVFIEVGPGTVLTDLLRRWADRPTLHTADAAGWSELRAALENGVR